MGDSSIPGMGKRWKRQWRPFAVAAAAAITINSNDNDGANNRVDNSIINQMRLGFFFFFGVECLVSLELLLCARVSSSFLFAAAFGPDDAPTGWPSG